MPELADIFRRYGGEYLRRYGDRLLPSHRRALEDIQNCRTAALGGHVYTCDQCGREQYAYHSCRNRSCPKCHARDTQAWLEARQNELLPVPYFHVVFTVPEELRPLVRSHQKLLYGLLMRAAAEALIKLAADPHYVGGLVGVLAVLHTWTRTLVYHPHVHCLVPAGGVSGDRQWRQARHGYLVPVRALSRIFRGMCRDGLARLLPDRQLTPQLWRKDWVVYCKPTLRGPRQVLNYLGRYVHRVAIANSRLVSMEDGRVTFRYQPCGNSTWKMMTLAASEFIRRFLQHVLPAGMHKVRYYGLWHPARRDLLRQVQLMTTGENCAVAPHQSDIPKSEPAGCGPSPVWLCPCCGLGALIRQRRLPRQQRAPP